jgi:hypothetical protein
MTSRTAGRGPLQRLFDAQRARPGVFLVAAAALTGLAGLSASTLRVDASYEALLPNDAPELQVVRDVRERTGGLRHLVVVVTGGERRARLAFAERLAASLGSVPGVRHVDVRFPVGFVAERGLWLLDLDELRSLADAVELATARAAQTGRLAPLLALGVRVDGMLAEQRGRIPFDEVLESRDGRSLFLWVVPATNPNRLAEGRRLLAAIHDASERLEPARLGLTVRPSGLLVLYREQHERMSSDLGAASLVALVLCALLVAAGIRWAPAPLVVCAALIPGVVWTFGLLRLWSPTINLVTGFLVPVLLGLGIDFSLHLLTRFRQELAAGQPTVEGAVERAVVHTFVPVAVSALTTAATFFCFALARFPGFREFGVVAGLGLLLTLASTYAVLPPLLLLVGGRGRQTRARAAPAWAAVLDARWLLRLAAPPAIALALLAVYGAAHARDIPYYNDFRRLHGRLPEAERNDWVNENLGFGTNPTVFVTGSLADSRRVAELARERRERSPATPGALGVGRVLAAGDLVPTDLDERRALVGRLRRALGSDAVAAAARRDERLAAGLRRAAPLLAAEPFSLADVPEVLRRRLVTLDGRGFLVYLFPSQRIESDLLSVEWVRLLASLSARLRSEGVEAQVADEVFIHGWISQLVAADAPRLLLAAVFVVLVVLAVEVRRLRRLALLAATLAVGVLAFVGSVHALGLHLNMFNLLSIPMVVGIGIDAAVHVEHRYRAEGPGSLRRVLATTGISVVLASATSAAGFGASLVCAHEGLRTLGTMSLLGIGATTAAALSFLPCVLLVGERRAARLRSPGAA